MAFILHLALCLVILGAAITIACQFSSMAHQSAGIHESPETANEFWSRLVFAPGAVSPDHSADLNEPARLARRYERARGRQIKDKLVARFAKEILPARQDCRHHEHLKFDCN